MTRLRVTLHRQLFGLVVLSVLSLGFAQNYTFADLQWGTSRTQATSQLQSAGYTFSEYVEERLLAIFRGSVLSRDALIYTHFTPAQALVNVAVYILHSDVTRSRRFFEAEKTYEKMVETLTAKYGPSDSNYAFFQTPYYRGDGYETQAVEVGKARFAAFWLVGAGGGLWIQIDEDVDIAVHYESPGWSAELERRDNEELTHF